MKDEIIGKVKLDYTKYPGEDLYSDGITEDELLGIVSRYHEDSYARIVEERPRWEFIYHLSEIRTNIVEWLPMKGTEKVLEVGAGCGAITGVLSRKASSVTCVDLSRKRSLINAERHRDMENIDIRVGNLMDVESVLPNDYDYIFLIGVLEYSEHYIASKDPAAALLRTLGKHLAPGGRIVVAIENRFGLKYFAGCREDHDGRLFSGLEGYPEGSSAVTYGRNGLSRIFKRAGFEKYSYYYPCPDYKFMNTLYSDKRLPEPGEMPEASLPLDRDRELLFDEKKVGDGIVGEGMFPFFANSFLAILGNPVNIEYVKYSNERKPFYSICTEQSLQPDGRKIIRKRPLSEAAVEHVRSLESSCNALKRRYKGGRLNINECTLSGDMAVFTHEKGSTLASLLDSCLKSKDTAAFKKLFDAYLSFISFREEVPVVDTDLAFSNILIQGNKWTLIDYEWTFTRNPRGSGAEGGDSGSGLSVLSSLNSRELAYRALYCYMLEHKGQDLGFLEEISRGLGLSQADIKRIEEKEMIFQKAVTGGSLTLEELALKLGRKARDIRESRNETGGSRPGCIVQVYWDQGTGFSEKDSTFVDDAFNSEHELEVVIHCYETAQALRIDPGDVPCLLQIKEVTLDGDEVMFDKRRFSSNGRILPAKKPLGGTEWPSLVFESMDPGFTVKTEWLMKEGQHEFRFKMGYSALTPEMAAVVRDSLKKVF